MGKKVLFTGSLLLGQELRRLRGTRTLGQICALSRTPPLSEHCAPIAEPTLSQIERGISMPTLESMYTLSVIYRVSMQQLQGLVVEERLARDVAVPEDEATAWNEMAAAMRAASWYDALALALRGERLAPTEPKRVLWRLNRASASEHLGMRQGALLLLLECAHSPDLPLEARCHALRLLASACISCGFLRAASDTARLALEAMDPRSPATLEVALLSTRARLLTYLIGAAEARDAKADQLREASEALERAQSINPPADVLNAHLLGLLQGRVAELRGCAAEAEVGYTSVLAAARADNSQWPVLLAEACLGSLMRRASRLAEAELHLEEAERLAAEQRRIDGAFEVAFELHGLRSAQGAVREASTCLRNCPRLYPLVTARTPIVRAYERLTRSSP